MTASLPLQPIPATTVMHGDEDKEAQQSPQPAVGVFPSLDHPRQLAPPPGAPSPWVLPNPRYAYRSEDSEDASMFGDWSSTSYPKEYGVWLWLIAVLVPVAFIFIWLSLPLGDPKSVRLGDWLGFLLLANPVMSCAIGYFYSVTFLVSMNVARPFRAGWPALPLIALLSIGSGILMWNIPEIDPPPQFFAAGNLLAIVVIVTVTSLVTELRHVAAAQWAQFQRLALSFLKVQTAYFTYFLCLCVYLIAWKVGSCTLQRLLPIALTLVTFIYRKTLLVLTVPLELETAMMLAGFVIESMEDFFQVLAFPSVRNPSSFLIIWVVPVVTNLANLVFMTESWFDFRLWIKDFLKRAFCCLGLRPNSLRALARMPPERDLSHKPDDRGDTSNIMGYHRRQTRWLFQKLLSQALSMAFFLAVAPFLRWGPNARVFPYHPDTLASERFQWAMLFAGANLAVLLATVWGVHKLFQRWRPLAYEQVTSNLALFAVSRKHVAWAILTVLHNACVGLAVICYPYSVWFGFDEPPPIEPCE